MSSPPRTGVRAEARAKTLARIEEIADAQLRKDGLAGLSLRAISRDLGMAPSAIYRYFDSSDALLTHLLMRGYNQVADVVTLAVSAAADSHPRTRLRILASATREFFLQHPHIFALLYGTPVSDYRAPQDTVAPAGRVGELMVELVLEARALLKEPQPLNPEPVMVQAVQPLGETFVEVDPAVLAIGVAAWNQIFGLISFELFGHFRNIVADGDRAAYHAAVMDMWWDRLIGPDEAEGHEGAGA